MRLPGPLVPAKAGFILDSRFRGNERGFDVIFVASREKDGLIKCGHERVCGHFTNSAMASSASTPPVIAIGANGALAAISALETMI